MWSPAVLCPLGLTSKIWVKVTDRLSSRSLTLRLLRRRGCVDTEEYNQGLQIINRKLSKINEQIHFDKTKKYKITKPVYTISWNSHTHQTYIFMQNS